MSDFDFLESFIRETETYETKEIDPTAMVEENEEGDGRLFNYRPRQYDNVEMRRTNLYNILTEITKLESNIINKTVDIIIEMINSGINHIRHHCIAICKSLLQHALLQMFRNSKHLLRPINDHAADVPPPKSFKTSGFRQVTRPVLHDDIR